MSETTYHKLLELAAKAAGISVKRSRLDDPVHSDFLIANSPRNPDQTYGAWNPLIDDGDAMRLAALDLCVIPYPIYDNPKHSVLVQLKNMDHSRILAVDLYNSDPLAATRRAITRAAAEIGEAMP